MNRKIIDILFILILISAPFKLANHIFALPGFIGGSFARDFVIWPLLIGLIYTSYYQWKYKNIFYEWNKFKKYIFVYSTILLISLIWGTINFPYWDMFFNGQAMNNSKFATAFEFISKLGLNLDEDTVLSFWIMIRFMKNIVLNIFYTFGGAYMILCWYHDYVDRALELLKNVTVVFLIIVAAYGIVDMCYQNGQMWAQNFISYMWPIIHTNTESSYYPMFLGGRNRSLFLEASYFCIYMAFAFPLLWWKLLESKGIFRLCLALLYLILACEIFLAQSRTGTAIFLGELSLLVMAVIYKRNRVFLTFVICLLIGAFISFGSSIYFLQNFQVPAVLGSRAPLATKKALIIQERKISKEIKNTTGGMKKNLIVQEGKTSNDTKKVVGDIKKPLIIQQKQNQRKNNEISTETYLNDSLLSLIDEEKAGKRAGSNHVRLGITKANIEIGLQHPLLGVGSGLDTAYLYEKFKNDQNREIKYRFIKPLEEKGLLSSGSPVMCEYSAQFMQTGFLGIFFFVLPMGYILVCFLRRLYRKIDNEKEFYAILFITLADIGIFVTGFGNTVNITYCYWLMLGISYVVEFALRERKQLIIDKVEKCA